MQLLIVRHADAGDAEEWARSTGRPDSERQLSAKGEQQMGDVAKALVSLVPECARVVSSPYVRARETALYLTEAYGLDDAITTETLEPEAAPEQFADWLTQHPARAKAVTAVTGHEPHLSTFITWLVAGTRDSRVRMKKAGACLLRVDDVRAGEAELLWLLTPDQMKAMAK